MRRITSPEFRVSFFDRGCVNFSRPKQCGTETMPIYELDNVKPEIAADCWIAPDAVVIGKVRLLKGASIWFGAVLRGDNDWITIGPNSNVQDHSIIHADPGQPVTIGRRVIVHSAQVDDHSLIGMGAILLNRAHIGSRSLVGAGALVTEDRVFDDGKLILGSPAKAMRDLT